MVKDSLEELARVGGRRMLLAALNDEVDSYLQRDRRHRQAAFRAYPPEVDERRVSGSVTVELEAEK